MARVGTVAGRYERVTVDGVRVRLLLAKNPAGWAEALELIRPAPLPVVIGINARVADGHDPSWLWDVPFEKLGGRHVVATGERGRDLAVRLRYAGVAHEFVDDYVAAIKAAGAPEVDLAANYTSFQDARLALADRA
jgi:UDP-N-acetylmuramyl tripeptide synthase